MNAFIDDLKELKAWMLTEADELELAKLKTRKDNPWFDLSNINKAIRGLAEDMLDVDALSTCISKYSFQGPSRSVGVITAGNIPLVGFQDVLYILASNHSGKVKLSSKDAHLLPAIVKQLERINPKLKDRIQFVERLHDIDAVIATGSNNSARYFDYYFGKLPHVIRKNRNSVAVLKGDESGDQLKQLGSDVFDFYGLGCRSVSQLLLPTNYDENKILDQWESFKYVLENSKYENNFQYNYAVAILNKEEFKTNNFLIVKESESVQSRIGVLHLHRYKDNEELKNHIRKNEENIQIIVGQPIDNIDTIPFGESQKVGPEDYADGVDIMKFLSELQ